ncbi:MAG: hypothetical protein JW787_11105 [Sedimentisphaerales bacterium]|nr:hypothetical protein [Sedimentisphaerales bacterium]
MTEKVQKCPDAVKASAKNLEQLGIDKIKIKKWKDSALASKTQPCNSCQRLNAAVYILKDENGTYKSAVKELIKIVEKSDPNAAPPTAQQQKEAGNVLMNSKGLQGNALASSYIDSLEDLRLFLVNQIRLPRDEAQNFILDNYFIPLMQNNEKLQDPNRPQVGVIEPKLQ